MIAIYLILSLLITLSVFLIRNRVVTISLVILFVLLQWTLTVYEYLTLNTIQLLYFTPDAIGVILLTVMSVLASMSFLYSFIYLNSRGDSPKVMAIFLWALIFLFTAISTASLPTHVAIGWILVKKTTLSSS